MFHLRSRPVQVFRFQAPGSAKTTVGETRAMSIIVAKLV